MIHLATHGLTHLLASYGYWAVLLCSATIRIAGGDN